MHPQPLAPRPRMSCGAEFLSHSVAPRFGLALAGNSQDVGSRYSRESRADPSQDLDPEILGETRSIGEEQASV